jgi:signal peptidase I
VQYNYYVQTKGAYLSEKLFRDWGVSNEDRSMLPDGDYIAQFLPFKKDMNGKTNPIYHLPLTKKALAQVKKNPLIDTVFIESDTIGGFNIGGSTYPLNEHFTWTRDNYGPIWIPKKDATIDLKEENLILYAHVIRHYEGKELLIKNGKAFIDGKEVKQYTFKMDYYWMMGDNRHNSADSRAWGFVPEDHVVGKPILVWLSLDKDRKLFDGKIRWKRLFMKAS